MGEEAMSCPTCRNANPIEDKGVVHLRASEAPMEISSFPYESKEELFSLLTGPSVLGSGREQDSNVIELAVLPGAATPHMGPWLPLEVWQARLKYTDMIGIIQGCRFASHMQPILDLRSDRLYGYEFLLRPREDGAHFSPYELFQAAQETGFHSFLDRAARISAIETSAQYVSKGLKRFVNFLPSSIYNPEYCLTHTFEAIHRNSQDPADFVFEVVETERIVDIPKLISIFEVYKRHGMKVALDDVGAGHSTLEVLVSLKPDYVKIDRELVSYADERPERLQQMKTILETARTFGATVLAEGLERPEELQVCREAGIDLVQGYLIGKPAPRP